MKSKLLFLLLGYFCGSPLFAQKEANHWFFGVNAGLNFSNGSPTVRLDGQLNSFEAAGSISDQNGNLLFYTDGRTVWAKNHQVMPNGTGLLGHDSASQGVLIVAKPNSTTIFYIFTMDAIQNSLSNGLRVHTVDMSLNGGLGDVSEKNIRLGGATTAYCEKITSVRASNCQDIWIITHQFSPNKNQFDVFKITSAGVQPTPITSQVGYAVTNSINQARGCIKASPNGKLLAYAIYDTFVPVIEMLDFDNATGSITNARNLTVPFTGGVYGVEFSPDNSKLYISNSTRLLQFDLSAGTTAAALNASRVALGTALQFMGSLQVAPDGKIYVAKEQSPFLGVVNFPNLKGTAANFVVDALSLQGRISRRSLPAFVQSIFADIGDFNFLAQGSCAAYSFSPILSPCRPNSTYFWDFGDPASGSSNTSTLANPSHAFTKNGTFTVKLTLSENGKSTTVAKNITVANYPVSNAGADKTICYNGKVQIGTTAQNGTTYRWIPAENLDNATVAMPTFSKINLTKQKIDYTYVLEAKSNERACLSYDTVKITVLASEKIEAGKDTSMCSNDRIVIGAKAMANYVYTWQGGGLDNPKTAQPTFTTINPNPQNVNYTLILNAVASPSTCDIQPDTVVITVKGALPVQAGIDKKLCFSEQKTVLGDKELNGFAYSWSPIANLDNPKSANPIFAFPSVTKPTDFEFILQATANACQSRDTVKITVYPLPFATVSGKIIVCPFEQSVYKVDKKIGHIYQWTIEGGVLQNPTQGDSVTVVWGQNNEKARIGVVPKNEFACQQDTFWLNVKVSTIQPKIPAPKGITKLCELDKNAVVYQFSGRTGFVYNWAVENGKITEGQGTASVKVAWDKVGEGKMSLTESSTASGEACIAYSDTLKVQILPSPQNAIVGESIFCEQSTQGYKSKGLVGSTYFWEIVPKEAGKIVTGQGKDSVTVAWAKAGNALLKVTQTSKDSCKGNPTELPVVLKPIPQTVLNPSFSNICPQQLAGFVLEAVGFPTSRFVWQVKGGAIVAGQNTAKITVNWNTESLKSVTVQEISENGCVGNALSRNFVYDNSSLEILVVSTLENSPSDIQVEWKILNPTALQSVELGKKESINLSFTTLSKFDKNTLVFVDKNQDTNNKIFDYQVFSQNNCGFPLSALPHQNIKLSVQKNEEKEEGILEWNPYLNWTNGVREYEIWRKMDEETAFQLYDRKTQPNVTFTNGQDGFVFCYRIKAIENQGNQKTSWSNVMCVEFEHPIWIPNVITPNGDGKNDVWKIRNLPLYKDNVVEIFNRWGDKVWETRNYQNDWDGGNLVGGTYYYRVYAPRKNQEFKGWLQILK